jgi:non-specific protein-tyrosine kinase
MAGPVAPAEMRTATAALHPLLVAAIHPHADIAERYRSIRARISHREETMPLRTLMVTSPGAGDGKSITAANLALTMAQEFQRRVALVDADFRGSSVHSLFGLEGSPGLSELLTGEATLDEVLLYLPDHRLTLIPAGKTPPFPTELLGSSAMRRVVDTLRGRFDRVLFDTPAVMPLADAGTFAPMADGVLIVVRAGLTQRPALDRAIAAFDDDKVVGVVLNDTM